MDEAFEIFLDTFGQEVVGRREVPVSSIIRYENKLPGKLIDYWREHGWAGYGGGVFWTVNPEEYAGVVDAWLEGSELEGKDSFHVIARSAFGLLYLWGEATGPSLKIATYDSRCVERVSLFVPDRMDRAIEAMFLMNEIENNDFCDMFVTARKKLGALNHDEMYGFVPALLFGGKSEVKNLQKVKAVEHLMILSQIAPLRPYEFADDQYNGE